MPIRILPRDVASQIAAGEVVERPASVVKELVENSIDADARDVRVETREGGKKLIRVSDDGYGVPVAEVELAFQRHSTSKLNTADDLDRITTLGFRGEALASIASVSRVTFVTRAADENIGALIRIEGGRIVARQESGRPPGVGVSVENLFFNVPARRKFLRTNRTERRHIDAWLTRYAMAYPQIRFTLTHDDKTTFQSPGNDSLRDVLIAVYNLEIGAALLEIMPGDAQPGADIRVSGFVSPPSLHRANRTYITLFVNGRWVKDASLSYAIVQAYHSLIPHGRYPLAVVMIDLAPAEVDVNVHPAKSEVRFRDGDVVFRAVQKAVRQTLLQRSPTPVAARTPTAWPTSFDQRREERIDRLSHVGSSSTDRQLRFESRPSDLNSAGGNVLATETTDRLPPLRVIGQVGATYVVAEGPEGMYLIDQHAAHERVLFEQLLAQREQAQVASQAFLEPQTIELGPEAAGLLEEHLDLLKSLGFQVEPFGGDTMLARAVPLIVAQANPVRVLEDVAAALEARDAPLAENLEEAVAQRVCKRAAIKAGQVMSPAEMEELIRALERCENPLTCPHGRPTMIRLTVAQLAREFGR
jgi:DNA mismatch repair protein MutL